jgi:hypothetical protein
VTASAQDGEVVFQQQREYMNIAFSPSGEQVAAAWSISRYSEEKSTSFKPNETKTEIFTISIPQQGSKEILVQAKIVSYHGMPVTFDEPASGVVMLEASKNVVLK